MAEGEADYRITMGMLDSAKAPERGTAKRTGSTNSPRPFPGE